MEFPLGAPCRVLYFELVSPTHVEFTENETKNKGILWKILVKTGWIVYNITMK